MRLLLLMSSLAFLAACNKAPDPVAPSDPAPAGAEIEAVAPAPEAVPTVVTPYQRITFEGTTATEAERAACEAAGGDVRPAGRGQFDHCIQSFDDAGEACTDGADCQGTCLVGHEIGDAGIEMTGQCAPDDGPFGCYQEIENGLTKPGICVD